MQINHLTYATVCSGIECMSAAVADLPMKPVFFSEIEPFPCAVLKSHFPDVPNLGDMNKITVTNAGKEITNGSVRIVLERNLDIFAGGTPCQDVSVAGKRSGMQEGSGTRSSLAFEFVRLVRELKPRYVLWENVAGVLSDKSFPEFLSALANCGYGVAYRTLDAQWVRVADCYHADGGVVRMERAIPQRRRRVWVVGCAGGDVTKAAQILFEQKGITGDNAPRRITLKEAADLARKGDRLHAGVVEAASETDDGLIVIDGDKLKPRLDQRKGGNRFGTNEENVGYTLTVVDRHGVAVKVTPKDECFENRQSNALTKPTDVSPCIGATRNASAYNNNPLVVHEQGEKTLGVGRDVYNCGKNAKFGFALHKDAQPTLTAKEDGGGAVRVEREIQSRAFKLDSMAANSMKSPNPKSGIHEVGVAGCLDTTVPQPSKNQGGTVPVHERIADGISSDAKTGFTVSKGIAQTQVNGTCPGHRTGIVEAPIAFEPGIATREGSVHRFVESVSPTIRAGMGDNQTAVAMAYDGYNQSGHDEVSQTLRGVGNSEGERWAESEENDPCPTIQSAHHHAAAIKQSFGINPQAGQMLPFDKECGETLAIGHQGGVMTEQITTKGKNNDTDKNNREILSILWQEEEMIRYMKYIVRRLTPTEAERLMGLPDGWTIPKNLEVTDALVEEFREKHDTFKCIMAEYENEPMPKPTSAAQVRKWLEKITKADTCPDAPRYKACGNGWATNQPRWILTRLLTAEEVEW